jgi:hypothetical protein
MVAPTLALELRETIASWFSARDNAMQSSELILAALADLAAEQIAANPTRAAQNQVLHLHLHEIMRHCTCAIRRRLGGRSVTIVKQ